MLSAPATGELRTELLVPYPGATSAQGDQLRPFFVTHCLLKLAHRSFHIARFSRPESLDQESACKCPSRQFGELVRQVFIDQLDCLLHAGNYRAHASSPDSHFYWKLH